MLDKPEHTVRMTVVQAVLDEKFAFEHEPLSLGPRGRLWQLKAMGEIHVRVTRTLRRGHASSRVLW